MPYQIQVVEPVEHTLRRNAPDQVWIRAPAENGEVSPPADVAVTVTYPPAVTDVGTAIVLVIGWSDMTSVKVCSNCWP
jgi:hypothetical protein